MSASLAALVWWSCEAPEAPAERPRPTLRQDALLSAEFDPSAPVTSESGHQVECTAVSAFDGTSHLVLWEDQRRFQGRDIYGARVAVDGGVLDPLGLPIARTSAQERKPAIAAGTEGSGANVFLAAWESSTGGGDIWAARIDATGAVLDDAGQFAVSVGPEAAGSPAVAFDGVNFWVVWEAASDAGDIWARRFNSAGQPVDDGGFAIAVDPGAQVGPKMSCGATNCFVAWTDDRAGNLDVFGRWVGLDGRVLGDGGVALTSRASSQRVGGVAPIDGGHLVLWEDNRAGVYDIYAARVGDDLTVRDPDGFALTSGPGNKQRPFVANGPVWPLVAWQDGRGGDWDVYLTRVDVANGLPLDPVGFPLARANRWQRSPAISWNRSEALVSWFDNRSEAHDSIYGRFYSLLGGVDPERVLSLSSNHQALPRVGASDGGWLLAWADRRGAIDSGYQVYFARVGLEGTVLGGAEERLSEEPPNPLQRSTAVASDGRAWLVAWDGWNGSNQDLRGAVVGSIGAPIGVALIAGGPGHQIYPELAFDGTTYVAAWTDSRSGTWDVYAGRVSRFGTPLDDGGVLVAGGAGSQYRPHLDCQGDTCLIAWLDNADGGAGVRAATWQAGSVQARFELVPGSARPGVPRVSAASDAGFLIVWSDAHLEADAGSAGGDIFCARVDNSGGRLGPDTAVFVGPGYQGAPRVSFDGRAWFVLWEDDALDALGNVQAARISLGGEVFDDGGIALLTSDGGEYSYDLAAAAPGLHLVTYVRFDEQPPFSSLRVRARVWATSPQPRGASCSSSIECTSGFCADLVCCDEACGGGAADCRACSVAAGALADGTCAGVAAGGVCRPALSSCDAREVCSASETCGPDEWLPDGTPCTGGRCAAGVCLAEGAGLVDGGTGGADSSEAKLRLRLGCDCASLPMRSGNALALGLFLLAALRADSRRRRARSSTARQALYS